MNFFIKMVAIKWLTSREIGELKSEDKLEGPYTKVIKKRSIPFVIDGHTLCDLSAEGIADNKNYDVIISNEPVFLPRGVVRLCYQFYRRI